VTKADGTSTNPAINISKKKNKNLKIKPNLFNDENLYHIIYGNITRKMKDQEKRKQFR
jgi:hypothetical protein